MLVLMRHAQTYTNVEKRMVGQLDVQINDTGKIQCKVMSRDLRCHKWDAIFTSDLSRCLDTVALTLGVRQPDDKLILAEELRERSGGLYEGMLYSDIRKLLPPKKYKLWQRDYFEAPPNGESMKDVEERVIPFAKKHVFPLVNDDQNIFVCTHAITAKVLIGYIKGLDETNIPSIEIPNAQPFYLYGHVR
jgi:2,3-bisphosphoglycerate-dependent phosphoglycerate mutase